MDKVSVIVPVYNCEKYIGRCIESLLNQTFINNEYIFVNDGSTDGTLDILKAFEEKDNRIFVLSKENTGVSDSRNKAIDIATGDYICFCDADDMYEPNYIEVMYNLITSKNVSLVRCNYKVIDKMGKQIDMGTISEQLVMEPDIKKTIIPLCLNGTIPCFSYLMMIKKENLEVKFPTDIAMMEDVVFYIELLLTINDIYITDEPLYTIMFNDEGATNNVKNYERNINNVVLVNNYIKQILINNDINSLENIQNLNFNNLRAIADFIFRNYLYGQNTIQLCENVCTSELISLIKETDLKKIGLARRILLINLGKKNFLILKLYFKLRKFIFVIRRRTQ